MTVSDNSAIDEKKADKMKLEILKAESENLKTGEKPTGEMVETIMKIIDREAKKSY